MKTPGNPAEDPALARKLNAILAELYSERGVPDTIHVDYRRQALIAYYATGGPVVHPMNL